VSLSECEKCGGHIPLGPSTSGCCPTCGEHVLGTPPPPPRHDEGLLRIYLSAMPLGKYHRSDAEPRWLFCDGKKVMLFDADIPGAMSGCIAALVHLLNTREQTEIPR